MAPAAGSPIGWRLIEVRSRELLERRGLDTPGRNFTAVRPRWTTPSYRPSPHPVEGARPPQSVGASSQSAPARDHLAIDAALGQGRLAPEPTPRRPLDCAPRSCQKGW